MTTPLRLSKGNIFRDLGFHAEEAESLRLRADLVIQVRRLIEARGLTQEATAALFGVTQPRAIRPFEVLMRHTEAHGIALFKVGRNRPPLSRGGRTGRSVIRPEMRGFTPARESSRRS